MDEFSKPAAFSVLAAVPQTCPPMTSRSAFLGAYVALALLELYAETLLPERPALRLFAKPALLFALSLYFFLNTRGRRTRRDAIFQAALAFAWLGDVLLMREDGFLAGLGAFLVMQVLYAVVFWKRPFRFPWQLPSRRIRVATVLLLVFAGRVFLKIQPNLGNLIAPVVVYLLVILAMALAAFNRLERVPLVSFRLVAVGAVLFVISDGCLALNRFGGDAGWLAWMVMPTYAAAQYLIVEGILRERVPQPMFVA